MADVVSNTGPLIALAQIDQFDLLRRLFGRIIIPPAVRAEIQDGSSVAALTAADLLLMDERAATRKARALGLRVIGTLGVLLLGKRAEHLSAIKPLLDGLRENDFRTSDTLYDQVLRDAGESDDTALSAP